MKERLEMWRWKQEASRNSRSFFGPNSDLRPVTWLHMQLNRKKKEKTQSASTLMTLIDGGSQLIGLCASYRLIRI